MNLGKTVFSQLMDFLPSYEFRLCVDRYHGHYKVKSFSCWDQFLCLAFAQLTYRESLRETCDLALVIDSCGSCLESPGKRDIDGGKGEEGLRQDREGERQSEPEDRHSCHTPGDGPPAPPPCDRAGMRSHGFCLLFQGFESLTKVVDAIHTRILPRN